jgi:hypothetical protein
MSNPLKDGANSTKWPWNYCEVSNFEQMASAQDALIASVGFQKTETQYNCLLSAR